MQPVRSRREGRYYAIIAEKLPALGYRTYEIVLDEGKAPESGRIDMVDHIVENDYYRIAFDPRTGAVNSLVDKELGLEMVDSESPWQLGAFIYESLENDRKQMERHRFDHCKRSGLTDVGLFPQPPGRFTSRRFCRKVARLRREIRSQDGTPVV